MARYEHLPIYKKAWQKRLPLLIELRERMEALKALLRICKEAKVFNSFNSFVYGSNLVIDISRQNEGWIKVQKNDKWSGRNSRPI